MDMNTSTMRKIRRSKKGQSIAEMPMGMWLLLCGFFIPLLGIATFGYKVAQIYWATRDACYAASVTSTYDPSAGPPPSPGMLAAAQSLYTTDMTGFNATGDMVGGTAAASTNLQILQQPIAGGPPKVLPAASPIISAANLQTGTYLYFIRFTSVSNIPPLIGSGWVYTFLPKTPGLNAPMQITLVYDDYVENPQGLTI